VIMAAPAYRPDAFAKDRVEALAVTLGLDLPHEEQWAFVTSEISQDLQAAPGSGKTSLIGLKLALLADAWTSPTRGICVLSHTNTAKDEIIDRLSKVPTGRRFLQYPHFIGTIQSFANTFLALPAVRAKGVEVRTVDDDVYASEASRLLERRAEFRTLKSYLERRHGGSDLVAKAVFVCEAGELKVTGPGGSLPFDPTTDSGKQLTRLKWSLVEDGVFRYQDMYAIAQWHLATNPGVAQAMTIRFPFVLLDEMQDTSDAQQHLLDQVFGSTQTIVQRVGDVNQAIFNDGVASRERASAFPSDLAAELPVSRRFGSVMAELASDLTCRRRQRIQGEGPEGRVGLLLFDDDSVRDVVPAFEGIANALVPQELLLQSPPRVLAARLAKGSSAAYPQSLSCYLPDTTAAAQIAARGSLIEAVRASGSQWASGSNHSAATELWNAIRTVLRSAGCEVLPPLARLERSMATPGGQVRLLLLDLLTGRADSDEAAWNSAAARLLELIPELTKVPIRQSSVLGEALCYAPLPAASATFDGVVQQAEEGRVWVPSIAGSIQSAKGETHSATLVLECLDSKGKRHDVHEVLKLLAERKDVQQAPATVQRLAQLIFVAATRATHLLMLAAHRGRVEAYVDSFVNRGWSIHEVGTALIAGVATTSASSAVACAPARR
jgi:hypothetical protein